MEKSLELEVPLLPRPPSRRPTTVPVLRRTLRPPQLTLTLSCATLLLVLVVALAPLFVSVLTGVSAAVTFERSVPRMLDAGSSRLARELFASHFESMPFLLAARRAPLRRLFGERRNSTAAAAETLCEALESGALSDVALPVRLPTSRSAAACGEGWTDALRLVSGTAIACGTTDGGSLRRWDKPVAPNATVTLPAFLRDPGWGCGAAESDGTDVSVFCWSSLRLDLVGASEEVTLLLERRMRVAQLNCTVASLGGGAVGGAAHLAVYDAASQGPLACVPDWGHPSSAHFDCGAFWGLHGATIANPQAGPAVPARTSVVPSLNTLQLPYRNASVEFVALAQRIDHFSTASVAAKLVDPRAAYSLLLAGTDGTARGAAGIAWYVVCVIPAASYTDQFLRLRGTIIAVTASLIALAVILLIVILRLLAHPLRSLSGVISCCARMDLSAIASMEPSFLSELVEVQRSVSYLAIRLFHYLKYLPHRSVVGQMVEADDEERRRSSGTFFGVTWTRSTSAPRNDVDDDGESEGTMSSSHSHLDEDEDGGSQEERGPLEMTTRSPPGASGQEPRGSSRGGARDRTSGVSKRTILINAEYERRRLKSGQDASASFLFQYSPGSPVYRRLLRTLRIQMREPPGEILVVFAETDGEAAQLLLGDDDVLDAFENYARWGDVPSIKLTVRKVNPKNYYSLFLAITGVCTVVSRLLLCISRFQENNPNLQVVGLLLLAFLAMQVAQNVILSVFLIRRFALVDEEFRAWMKFARWEPTVAILFGAVNVTNLEVIATRFHFGPNLRFNAPLAPNLLMKLRTYAVMGFIFGDILPTTVSVSETIIRREYRDVFVMLSVLLSVASVTMIILRHFALKLITSVALKSHDRQLKSGAASSVTRSLGLRRREVTLLQLSVVGHQDLFETMPLADVEEFLGSFHAAVTAAVRDFGGMKVSETGATAVVAFNMHCPTPQHTLAAYRCFRRLFSELQGHAVPLQLLSVMQHAAGRRHDDNASQRLGSKEASRLASLCERHRLVCGIVAVPDCCIGYVGTPTCQSLQHVDPSRLLLRAVCALNAHLGSFLLLSGTAAAALRRDAPDCPPLRLVDRVAVDLHGSAGTTAALQPEDVFEAVVVSANFAGREAAGGGGLARQPADAGEPALTGVRERVPFVAALPDSGVDPATRVAVERFHSALSEVFDVNLQRAAIDYVTSHPADAVAQRVFAWAQYVGASNEAEALTLPRRITQLGVARHFCETPDGRGMRPAERIDAMYMKAKRESEKQEQQLRPPRSERRAKEQRRLGNAPVVDRVIGLRNYSVTFGAEDQSDVRREEFGI